MNFVVRWIMGIFVIIVVGVLVYAFFPNVWYLTWTLASGVYRVIFIVGLIILAMLPALRS